MVELSIFVLKGYQHSIYSPMGLKEFLTKAYNIPNSKQNENYKKIYTEILNNISTFEKWYKKLAPTIGTKLGEGEKCRYSNQFICITRRVQRKKFESDIDDLFHLGKATDIVIKDICNAGSRIKDPGIKKEYEELIKPIEALNKAHTAEHVASKAYEDYLAPEEIKELINHFLKRDTASRGDEDVNLGTTLYERKTIKLPVDIQLTNNYALAMHKSGDFYYVRWGVKILKYNNEGKKIGEIAQGSFGNKSVEEIKSNLTEVWEI